ncbi:hypothetical protein BU26DRAFT_162417 [Trematosphaeria pertusa]|uniref:Uncharacterized protein n=1 Tax=Trematosphaeria pertusa TaxID=390896 RepID=A0A6A6HVN2_9PLEO|nr:uncharacterized protein BU26DRAFT_162417 [Trematosphaeria pertusa]KAF2241969.1 hypothetical protein BU26DRAFT_162417 [Trematosphaeria pertusa]
MLNAFTYVCSARDPPLTSFFQQLLSPITHKQASFSPSHLALTSRVPLHSRSQTPHALDHPSSSTSNAPPHPPATMTTSPKPKPKPQQKDQASLPYTWDAVAAALTLPSSEEVPALILSPSFLTPWTYFRDALPLTPGIAPALHPSPPQDKKAMHSLVTRIYTQMDALSTSPYDRPTPQDRQSWTAAQHTECLLYQAARNLASPAQPFATAFERKNLKNESGRAKAHARLRGLVMLVANLATNYTVMAPSSVIKRIEALRPARDPERSPILEVRVKWRLERLGVEELRRRVLDGERGGRGEREWLIGILMGKEGLEAGVGIKNENGGRSQSEKRGREDDEDEEEASKRARTV